MSKKPAARESWNQYYRALYDHAKSKPDAKEEHPWGDTVFKVRGKSFAFMGPYGSSGGVTVKPPADEREGLLELPYITKAKYIGRYGWVDVTVEDDESLRLALELIDDTYDQIASRRKSKRGSADAG
jgi:predicted DNA-binding protein (MmcQ/YjbR family)